MSVIRKFNILMQPSSLSLTKEDESICENIHLRERVYGHLEITTYVGLYKTLRFIRKVFYHFSQEDSPCEEREGRQPSK